MPPKKKGAGKSEENVSQAEGKISFFRPSILACNQFKKKETSKPFFLLIYFENHAVMLVEHHLKFAYFFFPLDTD